MGKERQKIRELNEENRKIYLQTKLFLRRDVKDRKERKSVLDEFFGLLKEAQDKDLSPEEFFPEGYEVFYRDLLAGLTVRSAEEKRKRILRTRAVSICLSIACLGFLFTQYLSAQGYIGIWTDGIHYIATDFNHYDYETDLMREDVEFKVDFSRLEEYRNIVIVKSGNAVVELEALDEAVGRYRIFFRVRGTYSRNWATLISWREYGFDKSHTAEWKQTAELFCEYEGEIRPCSLAGFTNLNYKDGETFGFHVPDFVTPDTPAGIVKFRLQNLTLNHWERRSVIPVKV